MAPPVALQGDVAQAAEPRLFFKHRQFCQYQVIEGFISLIVAGISCIDWSTRGSRLCTLGKGVLPFLAFVRDLLITLPDIAVLECTKLYSHEDVE